MGALAKIVLVSLSVFIAYSINSVYNILKDDPLPLIPDEYWGPQSESTKKEDTSIRPFKIDTPKADIQRFHDQLKTELSSTDRFAPELEDVSGFQYGVKTGVLKTIGEYWLNEYNWTARQAYLNKYPHFKTKIGGLDIHFQHAKGNEDKKYHKNVPILVVHGWPGSFTNYQKLIPLLTEPKDSEFNFEVVIPSLPGYGFSSPASRTGMSPLEMGNILGRLMKRLGYEKYYLFGEDWGTFVVTEMSILYPDRVQGTQCSCMSTHPRDALKLNLATLFPSGFMNKRGMERFYPLTKMISHWFRETGYFHLHATRPDTVGVGLNHSPIGLAAYILEKYSVWTHGDFVEKADGGLTEKFTLDELLDNVMIYWTSGSIISSMRLYSEYFNLNYKPTLKVPVQVPVSCIVPPEDIAYYPEVALTSRFPDLRMYTEIAEGGHFTAQEVPDVVADVVLSFVNDLEHVKSKVNL